MVLEDDDGGTGDGVGVGAGCALVVVLAVVEASLAAALSFSLEPVFLVLRVILAAIAGVVVLDWGTVPPSSAGEGTSVAVVCLGNDMGTDSEHQAYTAIGRKVS